MKKIFVLGFILLSMVSIGFAQGFGIGIKGGYLYSDVDEISVKDYKTESNSGYYFGLFTRLAVKSWFFQPELQYRVRTTDVVSVSDAIRGKAEVELKTIDVPLQFGKYLINLPMVRLAIHAGPTISFNINDDASIKEGVEESFDMLKDYKSFIWGGQIGLTADITRFTVGVSYEKGFSDISDELGKNNLILVNVGLNF